MGEVTTKSRAVVQTKPDMYCMLQKFRSLSADGCMGEYKLVLI